MTRRISVCLLVDTVGAGAGTERQVIETARRLNKEKFAVHVTCLEPSPQLEALGAYCETALFPLSRVYSPHGVRQLAQMRRYLDRHNVDIVHAFMNRTAICAVATSAASKRIVITSRLNTGYWYTAANRLQFRILNLGTTRIMANSEAAKQIAVENEKLDPARVDVVYQGVDLDAFKPVGTASACDQLGIPPGARVVGMVANLRPVKDIPLFLKGAALVAAQFADTVFLIAGSGAQLEELRTLAKSLGLHGRVFFTEGRGRISDYLSRMLIGCLTSHSEGFSNAVLEYMAAGLPTVATAVGGNPEAIVDGETGYLIRERTPEAVAKPLIELLGNEDKRRAMGRNAQARCAERFEIGKTILELEAYYTRTFQEH